MAKNCVGLDIGSSSVKVVQAKLSKKGVVTITGYDLQPLPPQTIVDGTIMDQSAIVDAVRDLWTRMRFKKKDRDVALAISGHSVIIKKIQVPPMEPDELAEQIPWEAEHHIPFAKDDVEIDYHVVTEANPSGQMELLLVAAKKEVVHDYTSVAREAMLTPQVVDVAAFSVQNAFAHNYTVEEGETVVLVNVGAAISNINIIRDGVSVFTRDVTIGGNAFTEEIQKQLNLSYEEAEAYKTGGGAGEAGVVPEDVERVIEQVAEVIAGEFQRSLDFFPGHQCRGERVADLSGGRHRQDRFAAARHREAFAPASRGDRPVEQRHHRLETRRRFPSLARTGGPGGPGARAAGARRQVDDQDQPPQGAQEQALRTEPAGAGDRPPHPGRPWVCSFTSCSTRLCKKSSRACRPPTHASRKRTAS